MNKLLLYISLTIFSWSCERKEAGKVSIRQSFFDSIQEKNTNFLDSLHLSKYNDSAKWRLYAIFCDDSCSRGWTAFNKIHFDKIPFSFLDLKLTYIDKTDSTLSLLYRIFYKDSINVSNELPSGNIFDGVIYDIHRDRLIGYIGGEGTFKLDGLASQSRSVNPLQPDVIKFFQSNKTKLNSWLRQEAKKKNVIQ